MKSKAQTSWTALAVAALGLTLLAACGQTTVDAPEATEDTSTFSYDQAALPGATPWTSESFASSPEEFQFAIIGDRTGGANVEGRPHTFFAGHLHYYDYDLIDGYEHITMGPAGASFHHEGPGNVDHMMWVTVTDDGPKMANIALKGVFDRKGLDPELFGAYDRKGFE